MRKVLFTTNIPSPYKVDFFNELGKYIDLTVVFERKSAKTRDDEWLQSKIVNFQAVFLKGIAVGDDTALCMGVIPLIKKENFDCIIIGAYYTPTGILTSQYLRLFHKPFSFSGDGGFVRQEDKIKRKIKNQLQSGGQVYFSPSKSGDEVLMNAGYKQNQIIRYPFTSIREKDILAKPVSREEKCTIREELGIRERQMVLGVGRLLDWKGWDTLFDATVSLGEEVGIYLVGGNPKGTCYERYAEKKSSNINFVEFKQKDALEMYYKAADVFVLPSHEEVWGLVVNEAMARGLPVITTRSCTAGRELVEDSVNGFLINPKNSRQLSEKLKIILQNTDLQTVMSNNSIKKIKEYTIENMAIKYASVIETLK